LYISFSWKTKLYYYEYRRYSWTLLWVRNIQHVSVIICETFVSQTSVSGSTSILGFYALSTDEYSLVFRRILMPLSSGTYSTNSCLITRIKVKVSHNRPTWPQGFRLSYGPGFSWRSALRGWWVVCLTYRPPLPQNKSLIIIFKSWVDPRAHGSVSCYGKNPQWHHRESIPIPSD
jgi:hypothetical protein